MASRGGHSKLNIFLFLCGKQRRTFHMKYIFLCNQIILNVYVLVSAETWRGCVMPLTVDPVNSANSSLYLDIFSSTLPGSANLLAAVVRCDACMRRVFRGGE